MREINTAYEAFHFLYDHPNCVIEDPDHPLYDSSKEWGVDSDIISLLSAPRSPEYVAAIKINGIQGLWRGQFINNLDIWYYGDTVSLETGPAYWEGAPEVNSYLGNMHDYKLDAQGKTFEEALIQLAKNVQREYGDYEQE